MISPILVTACGSSTDGDKINALKLKTAAKEISKVAAPGKFYLDFYQRELNAVWATKTADINAAAANISANHQYDLQLQVLSEVLTKVKADGASQFKKEFPTLDDYNANIFDDIAVSFTIPDDSKGNLKVDNDGKLTIYPASIINGATSEKHISYTLKLNSPEASAKDLSGSLKFDLQARFSGYNTGNGLAGNNLYGVYGNADMSTILAGIYTTGLDVGTKQAGGSYAFDHYNNSNGLASDNVYKVYGSNDMSTILVGEVGGGLDVGKRAKASDPYTFTNYKSSSSKLSSDNVAAVYGNANMSTIFVGTFSNGLDVGTISKADDPYTFVNYSSSDPAGKKLANNEVRAMYGNADLSTIFVGEDGGGLDVGTRASASDSYNFKNYSTKSSSGEEKLANDDVQGVYANADMSTILVGENGGGLDIGTRDKASDPYTFTNYSTKSSGKEKLAKDEVSSVYGNPDMSIILVGLAGGLDVGVKQADGKYNFTLYNQDQGILGSSVNTISSNADLSTILISTDNGLSISSNLWFA